MTGSQYLTANCLKVNSDKTHLLVMTTEQKRRHNPTRAKIVTEVETIEPTEVERLLGAYIHQDMKWTEYLRNNWSERRCADGFVESAVGHYFW